MKAAVMRGMRDLRLEEVARPGAGDREVLVQVRACGVCGTDVHIWDGSNREGVFPFIPGHEWAGEVIDVGPNVVEHAVGDRVVGELCLPCKVCVNCKAGLDPEFCIRPKFFGFSWDTPGCLTEFHAAAELRLHRIPDNLTYEEAALVEPVAVAYHGVWGAGGGVAPSDRVVIVGSGPIGMFVTLVCRAAGALTMVVEPKPYRQEKAREFGADVVIDPTDPDWVKQVWDRTGGLGASLIIECSGSDAGRAATLDIVGKRGRIVFIGSRAGAKVPFEIDKAIYQCATIAGSNDSPYFFGKALAFMSRHLVDLRGVITHRFTLDRVIEAFDVGVQGDGCGKIMILP